MHELNERGRAVIQAAREAAKPSAADRARVRAALAARLALPATTTMQTATAGSLAAKIPGIVGLLAVLTASVLPTQPPAPPGSARAGIGALRVPLPRFEDLAPVSSAADGRREEPHAIAKRPSGAAAKRSATTAPAREAGAEDPSSLAAEVELLRQAERALVTHDARASLEKLDELSSRFDRGVLREERLAARVLALCAAGETARAHAEAEAFLREAPRSTHAARVMASCAFGDAQQRRSATDRAELGHSRGEHGGSP